MIIDGKKIAEEIKQELKEKTRKLGRSPVLSIVYRGRDRAIEQFVRLKMRFGEDIGVTVQVSDSLKNVLGDGIIVQLPGSEDLIDKIPATKDIDALRLDSPFVSPVVLAIQEIFSRFNVNLEGKKIFIIGQGRLVGGPVAVWLRKEKHNPIVISKKDVLDLKKADVIISGAGIPGLIKPEMIAPAGVVLIDAGTSESNGKIKGDADPSCADQCALFTPVPGGLGPITVAMLFRNLFVNL